MGEQSGAVPPKSLLVFRQTRNVSPKRGLCSKESNKLSANGVQFEASEPQNTGHHLRIRKQELFFSHILQWRHFFLVFILEFVEIPTYFAFWFTLSNSKLKAFVPPKKIVYAPPVTLLWRRAWSKDEERWSVEEQIE